MRPSSWSKARCHAPSRMSRCFSMRSRPKTSVTRCRCQLLRNRSSARLVRAGGRCALHFRRTSELRQSIWKSRTPARRWSYTPYAEPVLGALHGSSRKLTWKRSRAIVNRKMHARPESMLEPRGSSSDCLGARKVKKAAFACRQSWTPHFSNSVEPSRWRAARESF